MAAKGQYPKPAKKNAATAGGDVSASWPFKDANGKPDYNIIVSEEEMAELKSIIGATTPDDKLAALLDAAVSYRLARGHTGQAEAAVRAAAIAYGRAVAIAELEAHVHGCGVEYIVSNAPIQKKSCARLAELRKAAT